MPRPARGHRPLPHTADVIIEAWGPSLAACYEEAVTGLIETFANPRDTVAITEQAVDVASAPADEMLLHLLDEVTYAIDVADGVPIRARIEADADGGLHTRLALAVPATDPTSADRSQLG